DEVDHLLRDGFIGTTYDVLFDVGNRHGQGIDGGLDGLHAGNLGDDFRSRVFVQNLLGDSTGGHATDGFARGRATTSAPVPESVLGVVGKVRVGRAVLVLERLIVRRAGVLVADDDADRRAQGASLEHARDDL